MSREETFEKKHLMGEKHSYVITYACVDLPTVECDGYKRGTSCGPACRKIFRTVELANEYLETVLIPNEEDDMKGNFLEEDGYSVESVREDGEVHVCLYEGEYLVRLVIFRVDRIEKEVV